MIRLSAGLALVAMLAACSQKTETPATTAGTAGSTSMGAATVADFKTALPVKELMGHVIDYNAFGVWHNQGWLIDKDGTHELFPTDDAGWLAAESAAISLAEASNSLLLPGRPQDDDRRWVDDAHMLYDAAMKASAAAEKKDKQAFFDAGGEMYEACVSCHAHYVQGDEPGPVTKLPALPNRTPPPSQ
jgi:hypothetical protein